MNTIEETIRCAGFGRKKNVKKQIELIKSGLPEGEELLGVGMSHPKPIDQIYVTNKKVLVHKIVGVFENQKTEIPLSSISSINSGAKGLGGNIEIVTSNNSGIVEKLHIHIAQEIKKLIDSLIA